MHTSVSVIIPTLNEASHLPLLLADLSSQTLQPFEVIVADGNSSDNTVSIARLAGAHVVGSRQTGVAHQRNDGAQVASGSLLCFIDADVRLGSDFIERTLRLISYNKLDIACPRYIAQDSGSLLSYYYHFLNIIFYLSQLIRPSGGGNCILVTQRLFTETGGFRADLTFEDLGFIRSAARRGKFRIVNSAVHVSTRRFKREGRLRLILKYTLVGTLVFFGPTKLANLISYQFSHYK